MEFTKPVSALLQAALTGVISKSLAGATPPSGKGTSTSYRHMLHNVTR